MLEGTPDVPRCVSLRVPSSPLLGQINSNSSPLRPPLCHRPLSPYNSSLLLTMPQPYTAHAVSSSWSSRPTTTTTTREARRPTVCFLPSPSSPLPPLPLFRPGLNQSSQLARPYLLPFRIPDNTNDAPSFSFLLPFYFFLLPPSSFLLLLPPSSFLLRFLASFFRLRTW